MKRFVMAVIFLGKKYSYLTGIIQFVRQEIIFYEMTENFSCHRLLVHKVKLLLPICCVYQIILVSLQVTLK